LLNASEAGDVTTAAKVVNKLGHKFELDPPVKQTEVSGSIEVERTVTICAACREPIPRSARGELLLATAPLGGRARTNTSKG
jgi:hypothetical protein